MNYDLIKKNFARGLWNAAMVSMAVKKGVITPKQYKEITGQTYQTSAA